MKNKRNNITKTIINLVMLLILGSITNVLAENQKNPCSPFDRIALQFAITQNSMHSPLELHQIEMTLGPKRLTSTSVKATHSWRHKNRVLFVMTDEDKIINKFLTGKDDGSPISRKMEQIYANLKSATSIWTIKNIQNQLGPGQVKRNKLFHYSWHCDKDSIKVTVDQNEKITSATIDYISPQYTVDKRLGTNHPAWDTESEYGNKLVRSWQRSFGN